MDLSAPLKTEETAAETVLEPSEPQITTDVNSNEEMLVDTTEVKKVKCPESNETSNNTKNPTESVNGGNTAYASLKSLTYYKSVSDKIRKFGSSYVFKQENIKSYTDTFGIDYKIGDHVYMDINKPNQPFAIACVLDFKLTKRDNVVIEVRWYFRPNEIPDSVYMPLMQDRITENTNIASDLAVLEPIIKGRELFASESTDIYPATFIKGKTRVFHYQDILEAKNFKPFADTFFCILTYNPEARRLANTQGEIRVGASHQAKLPQCDEDAPPESFQNYETAVWEHKRINDPNLFAYLQAARSIAAFAGICERGNTEDMYDAAQSDTTTIHALQVLNEAGYNTAKALKLLVKCQTPKNLDQKWLEEDQKKFVKGLGQFGKNFFRIRKELLPHKTTSELIEYYYLWKKTPAAQNNRLRRRLRPSSVKKLTQIPSNKKQSASINTISTNFNNNTNNEQFSGGSELDSDNNESDESSEQKQQSSSAQQKCCTNCFTNSSKDLQNGGRDNQLLCYDCRMYYKKYGELPRIPNEKSSSNNPVKCEYSNQLDKLESIDRLEKENLMETKKNLSSVKSENILTTQDNNELVANKTSPKFVQPAFINQTSNGETKYTTEENVAKKESPVKVEKDATRNEKSYEDEAEGDDEEDDDDEEELGEIKSNSRIKHELNNQTENTAREFEPVNPVKSNGDINEPQHSSHKMDQGPSSFLAVPNSNLKQPTPHQFPTDLSNKLSITSSSPKPAFSPLNFLSSPAPSQSPIPVFNPSLIPLHLQQQQQQQSMSAFSHFFPPIDMHQHVFNQQQKTAFKNPASQTLNTSGSSACASPIQDMMAEEDRRPPQPSNQILNKPTELIKADSNAMFVRVWDRGANTCSRTDLNFKYLPNAKYLRTKNELKANSQETSKSSSGANKAEKSQEKPASANSNGHGMTVGLGGINPNDLNKLPPHMAPFFNNFRHMANNPQEFEANFLNELLKNQFYNNANNQQLQQHVQNQQQLQQQHQQQQQQQLQNYQKQQQMQKLAFTENQILEQAKRSLEGNYQQQMAFNAQFNNEHLKNAGHHMLHTNPMHAQQKFQPEFEVNPALKQLRDIADARSSIGSAFGSLNTNAFNAGYNKNFF